MSAARIEVEHIFALLFANFAAVNWFMKLGIGRSPVGLWVRTCFLFLNCFICCYGSQAGTHFNVAAPTLEEYLALPH